MQFTINLKKTLMTVVLAAAVSTAQAQQENQQQPQFIENPWSINCTMVGEQQDFFCNLSKSLVNANTGQSLMTFIIQNLESGSDKNEMILRLPHGISVPSGAQIKVDEEDAVQVPVLRTDAQGVLAAIELSDDVNNMFKKGNDAVVSFVMSNGQTINVQFSLAGYTKSFDKYSAE